MAKKYTRAQWARIQSRLPEEDRVPYSESPDKEVVITPAITDEYNQQFATPLALPTAVEENVQVPGTTLQTTPAGPTTVTGPVGPTLVTGPTGTGTTGTGPTTVDKGNGLPAGFTAGPFPKGLEKFFGSSAGILGYRINTETDQAGNTFYTLSVATSPNSWSTFGAGFIQGANGEYTPFSSKASGPGAGAGAGSTTATTATGPTSVDNSGRQSAYDLLYQQFAQYGLQSLVTPLKGLIESGISPSEFTIRLRDTAAYKQRFGANQARINRGLRALSEAEYIELEDQYQNVMRQYGLPTSYYQRGELGRQEGFEKFISSDVSPVELEDRIQTAYNRVFKANAEVGTALRSFYPEITNGDILAYVLDPERALGDIKRKITAAEIGGAAVQAGLTTNLSDAEYLARYGVTKEQAQQGYRTISGYLPRASQLSEIYAKQGVGPYTQASAEREVFGTPGAAEEERKRQRITSLEQAAFSGSSGLTGGALSRERSGQF